MRLSVIIPAYNESAKITRDLETTETFLSRQDFTSEILVVDDGSRDETSATVKRFVKEHKSAKVKTRLLAYEKNRGKGYAIRYGVARAKGEIVAFMDSGLCVPVRFLLDGMEKIEEGADYAIASRRLPGTTIERAQPMYRRVGSQVFWLVVQSLMGVRVSDTQCGFKLYSAKAAKQISRESPRMVSCSTSRR